MKKTILIIGGILFILVLLGIWLYLLFFGAPESVDDVFSDFSFGGDAPVAEPVPEDDDGDLVEEESTVEASETERNPLRQITTEPVAGFQMVVGPGAGTSSPATREVIYIEAGTGHVYTYDVNTSEQERLVNETLPQTRSAHVSPDGAYVLIERSNVVRIHNLQSNGTSTAPETLEITGSNMNITNDNHLVYTTTENGQGIGVALNLDTQSSRTLFTTPMRQIAVSWGSGSTDDHIVYPRPASGLPGYAYLASGSNLERLQIQGNALNLIHNDEYIAYSYISDAQNPSNRTGVLYNRNTRDQTRAIMPFNQNKCSFSHSQPSEIWCGFNQGENIALNDWYKGLERHNDGLWVENIESGGARYSVNIQRQSGRMVDVDNMYINPDTADVLFRNKRDGTLWIYEN